jgi:hypothetical protein
MFSFYVWMVLIVTWCNANLPHGILIKSFQNKFKSIFKYVNQIRQVNR